MKQIPVYADEKGRIYAYDNAKFILIFFVVLAHAISPFTETGPGQYGFEFLWRILNTLHMPTLIFISGFFAKKFIGPSGRIKIERPVTYLFYYLAAQLGIGAFEAYVLHEGVAKSILLPRSSLWFLLCLFLWYMILPVIDKVRPEIMLPLAVVFGLLIGYDHNAGGLLSVSRAFSHFPFFLFGYYVSTGFMKKLMTKKAKLWSIAAAIFALGTQALLLWLFDIRRICHFNVDLFIIGSRSYFSIFEGTKINPAIWFLPRLWFYACAFALGYLFLVWVPKTKNVFTKFGSRTIAVYILHRFVNGPYQDWHWGDFHWLPAAAGQPNILALRFLTIAAAFLLTLLLSTKPCFYPFQKIHQFAVWLTRTKLQRPEG